MLSGLVQSADINLAIRLDDYTINAMTDYRFILVVDTPLDRNDILTIDFAPSTEITLPETLDCIGLTGF